ncbi:MAG TPA: hypothetical protein VFQ38_15805 [Longimicrobiales bacterium]|nr:hypothetical protein [Longimicrobiales bacterium]
MPLRPFTQPWAEAFRAAVNASASYREAASGWSWPVALVLDPPAPELGYPHPVAVVLDLDAGACRGVSLLPAAQAHAPFVLSGEYGAWKEVVQGVMDPVLAVARRRLRLEGSLARLAMNVRAARALVACAAALDTLFPDDAGSAAGGAALLGLPPGLAAAAVTAALVEPPAPPSYPAVAAERYLQLFTNSKRLFWDPADIDLSADREDWERIRRDHAAEGFAEQILQLLGLFHAGEASVTRVLAPFVDAVARAGLGIEMELFLGSQLYEEAKHYDFFDRYFREVLWDETPGALAGDPRAVLVDDLEEIARRLRREEEPARLLDVLTEGVTHYMGVVEAMLARTGYRGAGEALDERGWLPGLAEGFRLVRRDEGRHVAFGIQFLRDVAAADLRRRAIVAAAFDRQLPRVVGTIHLFDVPHPLVPLEPLQRYALDALAQFAAAAGLTGTAAGAAGAELELGIAGA